MFLIRTTCSSLSSISFKKSILFETSSVLSYRPFVFYLCCCIFKFPVCYSFSECFLLSVPLFLTGKESACSAGDPSSIPGSGRPPGERTGYLLQDSCLENSVDRGARQAHCLGSRRRPDGLTFVLPPCSVAAAAHAPGTCSSLACLLEGSYALFSLSSFLFSVCSNLCFPLADFLKCRMSFGCMIIFKAETKIKINKQSTNILMMSAMCKVGAFDGRLHCTITR